jgi:hypothetical protein
MARLVPTNDRYKANGTPNRLLIFIGAIEMFSAGKDYAELLFILTG